jgi:hypothetical protein
MSSNSGRFSAPRLMSSQDAGHLTQIFCSSNCHLKTVKSKPKSKLCYDRWSFGQSAMMSIPDICYSRLPKVRVKDMLWPTVSWPVCLSVKHPSGAPRPDFYYCQTVVGLLMWGALSDMRMGLLFTISAAPRQRNHSSVWVLQNSWPYFTVTESWHPQPGGPGPHIYIPQEQVGPVIPPGAVFPFCHVPQLARLRWRYSNLPPHRVLKTVWRLLLIM